MLAECFSCLEKEAVLRKRDCEIRTRVIQKLKNLAKNEDTETEEMLFSACCFVAKASKQELSEIIER